MPDIQDMTPGEILADVPIDMLILKMGLAIAKSQLELDRASAATAVFMASPDFDIFGTGEKKSLMDLGFTPTFYQFTESTIEVNLNVVLKVHEDYGGSIGGGASSSGGTSGGLNLGIADAAVRTLAAFGVSMDGRYNRQYDLDVTGNSRITTKLVALPPPQTLIDVIRESLEG